MEDGLPPHDIAAEEAVIAAILLDDDALPRVRAIVRPEDFFREHNGWAFEAACAIAERGEEVTIQTLAHELERMDKDSPYGWVSEFVELAGKYFTAVGVEAHAKIVARDAYYRRMIQAAGEIASLAYEGGPEPRHVMSESMGKLLGIRETYDSSAPKRMGWANVLTDEVGVPVGVPAIDKYIDGVCVPGRLVTLAGPSGFGKSLMAAQIARAVAEQGKSVFIASMEMDEKEYEWRLIQQVCGVRKKRRSLLTEQEQQDVMDAQAYIETLPITFWNKARITLEDIQSQAMITQADSGLDLLVIDYLGLMQLPGSSRDSEASRIGKITSSLKQLAVDLKIQVLLLSQMNRSSAYELRSRDALKNECLLTNEKYPVPFIEALKGSSSVEQDSDHVVFMAKHPGCLDQHGNARKHISIVVAKNRHGETGQSLMVEDFARAQFRQMTEDEIYKVAHGDMHRVKMLRIDQGYSTWEQYESMPVREGQVPE